MLSTPDDRRTSANATAAFAIGRVLTGASVVFSFAPPDSAVVEGWFARFR